jgi:hypothetical protein
MDSANSTTLTGHLIQNVKVVETRLSSRMTTGLVKTRTGLTLPVLAYGDIADLLALADTDVGLVLVGSLVAHGTPPRPTLKIASLAFTPEAPASDAAPHEDADALRASLKGFSPVVNPNSDVRR